MSNAPLDLKLPHTTADQPPLFTTLQACKEWLTGVPITNATQAQAQLLRQLTLLNRYVMDADERLKIVDYLRSAIYFIHGECIKRFTGRPLPLAPPEQAAFDSTHALWQALEIGFLLYLQDLGNTAASLDEDARKRGALAVTRALTTAQSIYLDHCSAGCMPTADFWSRLHKVYRHAEQLDLLQIAVSDKLAHATGVTAGAAYVEALLLAAAQPLELRYKQLAQVAYWAHRWATKVAVLQEPPADIRTPSLCVDLASYQAGGFGAPSTDPGQASKSLRWLDLTELRKTIKQRLVKLGEGISPKELKLGNDCVQPGCEILLRQVYLDWCKGGRPNLGAAAGKAHDEGKIYQLVSSVDAVHYYLSGEIFRSPEQSIYLSKREHDEIATFGHVATRFEDDKKLQSGYAIEDWRALAENVTDLRLQRTLVPNQPGGRLANDQLVAVRAKTPGDAAFQLGRITWVAITGARDTLIAGINLLPGTPRAVTLHSPASGTVKAQYCRGFCLPAIEGLKQAATVLTPSGWFRAGHIIEIKTDVIQKIRLTSLIERGTDYERCSYEVL